MRKRERRERGVAYTQGLLIACRCEDENSSVGRRRLLEQDRNCLRMNDGERKAGGRRQGGGGEGGEERRERRGEERRGEERRGEVRRGEERRGGKEEQEQGEGEEGGREEEQEERSRQGRGTWRMMLEKQGPILVHPKS
eukprot:765543-Hanusia_phi.AAC.1